MNVNIPRLEPQPMTLGETRDYLELLRMRMCLSLEVDNRKLSWELTNELTETALDLVRRLELKEVQ